jgi:hypothetical protein
MTMTRFARSTRTLTVATLALGVSACDRGAGKGDDVGVAVFALSTVPSDVSCLSLTVAGSRPVTLSVDVTPDEPATFTVRGLPIGTDTFTEVAFGSACASVTSASVATWVGDPVVATLVAGVVARVNIVLRHNGQAVVTTTFDTDGDALQPDGGAGGAGGADASTEACTPISQATACSGRSCGSVSDGCSGTYSCGDCSNLTDCNGTPFHCTSAGQCASPPTSTCLLAGTLIRYADGGERPIESVAVGDLVLGYDVATGTTRPRRVTQTFAHAAGENREGLVLVNGTLRATGNHLVYASGRWVRADELGVGDALVWLGGAGATATPASVDTIQRLPGDAPTYNIEVEGDHDYFADGVLVHNKVPICF